MGLPPVSAGAVKARLAWVGAAVAVTPVGASGTVAIGVTAAGAEGTLPPAA